MSNPQEIESEDVDRRAAVDGVLASFGMEGLEPDAETAALLDSYSAGRLTLEQFGNAIEQHVEAMRSQISWLTV